LNSVQKTHKTDGSGTAPDTTFGSEAYEWYHENYAPDEKVALQETSKLAKLRDDIKVATRTGDFKRAHELQAEFKRYQDKFVEGQKLREGLLAAVQREDFLRAHEYKQKLEGFVRKKSTISAGADKKSAVGIGVSLDLCSIEYSNSQSFLFKTSL